MGYEILLAATFYTGLYNKFRDQSSVKGLRRQWVEFQKVRVCQILTTKLECALIEDISTFPPTEKHKMLKKFIFIGTQECPKDGRASHEWVSKKENSHKNCFTFR